MKFKYQAKTKKGELQVGNVQAPSRDAAAAILSSHDLFILSLESLDVAPGLWSKVTAFLTRVKSKDIMVFSRQLATLLESHVPLGQALQTLYGQTGNSDLRDAVQQIAQDVSSGLSFSQALERQRHIFSSFYINMIHSAEVIGNMEETSGFLADYLEKEQNLTTRARSALIYPAVVITLFIVVLLVIVLVVFPQIGPIFQQAGVTLPLYTRVLFGFGVFLAQWWIVFVVGIIIVVVVAINYFQTQEGHALTDELKIRTPLLKRVYVPLTITRLSNVMALLLRGGIPVTQAVEIAGLTINNVIYKEAMQTIASDVRQGKPLSAAITRFPDYFPPLASQMLVVGEATGQLDKMFSRLSDFYGRETDALIGNLVELIQPALMIVIGLMVGLLFASILVPLYQLTSTIQ
jgi:type IV pilus assembly protein PilC